MTSLPALLRLVAVPVGISRSKAGKLVTDGPFAETKEQLLGIYTIEVADLEGAMNVVRDLAAANPTAAYEIRPIMTYVPDAALAGDG